MTVEELILHRIEAEDLMWSVEDQDYYTIYWHTDDCLACKLFGMPTDSKDGMEYFEAPCDD